MISGMTVLLTRRRAEGWVSALDDPTAPLVIRVRDQGSVLAQIALPADHSEPPSGSSEKERARNFRIVFATPQDSTRLSQITVEAAVRGSSNWHILPRQINIPGPE